MAAVKIGKRGAPVGGMSSLTRQDIMNKRRSRKPPPSSSRIDRFLSMMIESERGETFLKEPQPTPPTVRADSSERVMRGSTPSRTRREIE